MMTLLSGHTVIGMPGGNLAHEGRVLRDRDPMVDPLDAEDIEGNPDVLGAAADCLAGV